MSDAVGAQSIVPENRSVQEEDARELVPDRRRPWHRSMEGMRRKRLEAGRFDTLRPGRTSEGAEPS